MKQLSEIQVGREHAPARLRACARACAYDSTFVCAHMSGSGWERMEGSHLVRRTALWSRQRTCKKTGESGKAMVHYVSDTCVKQAGFWCRSTCVQDSCACVFSRDRLKQCRVPRNYSREIVRNSAECRRTSREMVKISSGGIPREHRRTGLQQQPAQGPAPACERTRCATSPRCK